MLWLSVGFLVICGAQASAALYLQNEERYIKDNRSSQAQAWVDERYLRIELRRGNQNDIYLFDRDGMSFVILNERQKTFRVYAQAEIEKGLKGYDAVPLRYAVSLPTYKEGWRCNQYNGVKQGVLRQQMFTVDRRQFEVSTEAYRTLQSARVFLDVLAPDVVAFFHAGNVEWERGAQGYAGIPVIQNNFDKDGQLLRTTQITQSSAADVPTDFYSVPEDYREI